MRKFLDAVARLIGWLWRGLRSILFNMNRLVIVVLLMALTGFSAVISSQSFDFFSSTAEAVTFDTIRKQQTAALTAERSARETAEEMAIAAEQQGVELQDQIDAQAAYIAMLETDAQASTEALSSARTHADDAEQDSAARLSEISELDQQIARLTARLYALDAEVTTLRDAKTTSQIDTNSPSAFPQDPPENELIELESRETE